MSQHIISFPTVSIHLISTISIHILDYDYITSVLLDECDMSRGITWISPIATKKTAWLSISSINSSANGVEGCE